MDTKRFGYKKITEKQLKPAIRRTSVVLLAMAVITLSTNAARADESSGYTWGLALTIGEGMYIINDNVERQPVSLEVVPSFGWRWFKFDLGLCTTLESVKIAGTNVGDWNFTFRPGARLTPPMLPLYLRVAVPLDIYEHHFDWGLMFGIGADFKLVWIIGLVIEVDTALKKDLSWGGDGVPLEFRAGVSFHF